MMKKTVHKTLLILVPILALSMYFISCEKKEIQVVNHNFEIQSTAEKTTYINQPICIDIQSSDFDQNNDHEVETFLHIIQGSGHFLIKEDRKESGCLIKHDYRGNKKGVFNYIPETEGEHIIVIEAISKVVTKSDTIRVKAIKPLWDIVVPQQDSTEFTPLKKEYQFDISVMEQENLENTYQIKYRFLNNSSGTIRVNETERTQNKYEEIKRGNNVSFVNIQEEGKSLIEFTVKDKFNVEITDTAIFNVKGVNPIQLSVDKTSQTISVGEAAIIYVTIQEEEYDKTFELSYELISGSGTFSGQATQTIAPGTHKFTFTPSSAGTHTFKLNVIDKNGQTKEQMISVTGENDALTASLNLSNISISLGESTEFVLAVNEKNYNEDFYFEYSFEGSNGGILTVNNNNLGQGIRTTISKGTTNLKFNSSSSGTTIVNINVSDKRGQTKYLSITIKVGNIITVSAAEGGTVTGGGVYEYGKDVTIIATPNNNYIFNGWFENGVKISAEMTYTFKAFSNRNITAYFTKADYVISALAGNGGMVTGAGTYQNGSSVNLVATPETGYNFDGWYEGGIKITNEQTYSFRAYQNRILEAKFFVKQYNFLITQNNGGTISGTSSGLFPYNSVITVKATLTDPNYDFDGWYESSIKVSSNLSYTFLITKNITLEAKFKLKEYLISVTAGNGGMVTGEGIYEYGSTVTVKATPNQNYDFEGWYDNGEKISGNRNYSFSVTNVKNLEARFIKTEKTIAVFSTTGGSVTGSGNYSYNSTATVTASTATGYTFDGWYEGSNKVSVSFNYSFTVTENRTLQARFISNVYSISAYRSHNAGGDLSGIGSYSYGSSVTLSTSVNTGYTFDGWYDDETKVSSSTSYTFTVNSSNTYYCKYIPNKYNLVITVKTGNDVSKLGGSASSGGEFNYNSTLTSSAYVKDGYTFDGWYENGVKVSTNTSYTFIFTGNRSLEAKFLKLHKVTLRSGSSAVPVAFNNSNYSYNQQEIYVKDGDYLTLNAKSVDPHFTFQKWIVKENFADISASNPYTFIVTRDINITTGLHYIP